MHISDFDLRINKCLLSYSNNKHYGLKLIIKENLFPMKINGNAKLILIISDL